MILGLIQIVLGRAGVYAGALFASLGLLNLENGTSGAYAVVVGSLVLMVTGAAMSREGSKKAGVASMSYAYDGQPAVYHEYERPHLDEHPVLQQIRTERGQRT